MAGVGAVDWGAGEGGPQDIAVAVLEKGEGEGVQLVGEGLEVGTQAELCQPGIWYKRRGLGFCCIFKQALRSGSVW